MAALLSSVFPNTINYFISKHFLEEQYILVEIIFENERFWIVYYLIVAIYFSVIPKGFNNMQFKSSAHKKL